MAKDKQTKPVFHPKGARWLLEGGGEGLTDDERALLLAMIEVDAENLDERERAAVDELKEQVNDYDTNELAQAVTHMVTAKPRGNRLSRSDRRSRVTLTARAVPRLPSQLCFCVGYCPLPQAPFLLLIRHS